MIKVGTQRYYNEGIGYFGGLLIGTNFRDVSTKLTCGIASNIFRFCALR